MLRIISSKLAQNTPGNLSIPGTNQEVLGPYKRVWDRGVTILKDRQEEKRRRRYDKDLSYWNKQRNPANGQCKVCGDDMAVDQRGRPFCPSPECNRKRPRMAPPKYR